MDMKSTAACLIASVIMLTPAARAAEAVAVFTYRPVLDDGDGASLAESGIPILPVLAWQCSADTPASMVKRIAEPLMLKAPWSGRQSDHNVVSLCGLLLRMEPQDTAKAMHAAWRAEQRLIVDLTSSSLLRLKDRCGRGTTETAVAASIYCALMSSHVAESTTVTVVMIAGPEAPGEWAAFAGHYHWDCHEGRLKEKSIGGYVLTPNPQGGWICDKLRSAR